MSSKLSLFSPRSIAWYFYDFANSLLIINGSLYFSQWIVVDNNRPDFWYGISFVISTICLVLTAPYLGVYLDHRGVRKKFLFWLTVATASFGGLIEIVSHALPNPLWAVVVALIFYAIMNLVYQLSLLVYNTYLRDIAPDGKLGFASGLGYGIGTVGSMVGLLITYPIISGQITFFGTDRISMLLPIAALFFLCSVPMLIASRGLSRTKDDPSVSSVPIAGYREVYRGIWRDLRSVRRYPGVLRFLLSFYFFSNAQLTIFLFAAIYLDKVLHAPDSFKVVAFLIVLGMSSVASWLGGWLGDKIGYKPVFLWGLILNALSILGVALGTELWLYYILFTIFGLSTGAGYASSRALLAHLVPYEKKGQFFGLYSLSERFASILGPAIWGLVVFLVSPVGGFNYRMGAIAMGGLVIIAIVVVRNLKVATYQHLDSIREI